jgi:hypothetical protein
MDVTRKHPKDYVDIRRSFFAFSGVSGGAVGLTLTRTALAEAGESGDPPCKRGDQDWFGNGNPARDPTQSWRACLQALAAGDFLSPTVAGLFLRDNLAIPVSSAGDALFSDRAVLLEQALERRYNSIVHNQATPCAGGDDERGLCRALGYRTAAGPRWTPLLLLSGTSVDTGRPVIASDVEMHRFSQDDRPEELSPFSLNLFELLGAREVENPADRVPAIPDLESAADVRLSTAAVLSARFPVISPSGTVRRSRGEAVAHIVDGGYFDGTGLLAFQQLIPILTEQKLRVTVIYITNDAWDYEPQGEHQTHAQRYWHLPGRSWGATMNRLAKLKNRYWYRLFGFTTDPFYALDAARSEKAEWIEDAFGPLGDGGAFRKIRVFQRPVSTLENLETCIDMPPDRTFDAGEIPMNWWLSPVIQRVIDTQLCSIQNEVAIKDILHDFTVDAR